MLRWGWRGLEGDGGDSGDGGFPPRTSGIGGGWTQVGFPPSLWISKNRSYFRIRLYFFWPLQETVEINENSAIFFAAELSGEFPESSAAKKSLASREGLPPI